MTVRNLPSQNFDLTQGLVTNLNPRTVAGNGLAQAENVHFYEEFRSAGKMYGSTAVSPDLGGDVVSLHPFEYTDLTYTRQRTAVAVANAALRYFDTTSSWPTPALPSGATLTSEAMGSAIMLDRLHLSSRNQHGLPTGGLKFDGERVTNWGVLQPGGQITTLQALDSAANWTDSAEATSSDATPTFDGGGSVKVVKDVGSSALVNITRGSQSHDVTGAGQDAGYVYLYLSPGVLQDLEDTEPAAPAGDDAAVELVFGTSGFTNAESYYFHKGDLVPGWNLLTWVWASSDFTHGSGATLANITDIKLQIKTEAAGTDWTGTTKHILWDYLYITDEGACTAADSGGGTGPTGTYTYRVTYLTEYGLESNAGPSSNSVTVTDNDVSLTAIPTSSDDQVIARRIYRDISSDGIYRFVAQIDDNSTTTYTDAIEDAALSVSQPPFAGDSVLDNSPPGRLDAMVVYGGRVVAVDADNRNIVKISEAANPEAFRIVDQLTLEEDIIAVEIWEPHCLLFSTDKIFVLQGDGLFTPFNVSIVNRTTGANGRRAVVPVKGFTVGVHEERVSMSMNPESPWTINSPVLDKFRGLDTDELENMHVVHDPRETRIIFFAKDDGSSTYDKVFVYQYGTQAQHQITGDGAGTSPQDSRQGAWFELTLPTSIDPQCSAIVERTADKPEVWIGSVDNRVYYLDPTATTWATFASTENVTMTMETSWVSMDHTNQVTGTTRGEPRFLRIHQSAAGAVSYTVTVTLARDPEVDNTTPITVSWTQAITGNESLVVPIPMQGAGRGEWCKVKLVSTSADTPVIQGLEIFYVPRNDFSGPRS
jgi:hypothetical protein